MKTTENENKTKTIKTTKMEGYPLYLPSEDIYNQAGKEDKRNN